MVLWFAPNAMAQRNGGATLSKHIKGHNVGLAVEKFRTTTTYTWKQTADKTWTRQLAGSTKQDEFQEKGRDEWSVYLKDKESKGYRIDLWQKRVYDETTGTTGDIVEVALQQEIKKEEPKITVVIEATGQDVTRIEYAKNSQHAGGYFKQTGVTEWVEYKTGSSRVNARFTQTGRGPWSVFLTKSDGLKLRLDLHQRKVLLNNSPFYDITKATKEHVHLTFNENHINTRNILGKQTVSSTDLPARKNQVASWNYRGNIGRREINANGLGRCYDVRKVDLLDWTDETLKSGQSAQVFDLYRDDSRRPGRFNNQDLVIPFGVTFQSSKNSVQEATYKHVVTAHEFEREVTQEYRANVGVPKLGAASVSVGFKNGNSHSNKTDNLYTFSKMYKQFYKLDLELDNPRYKHQLSDRFWDGVRQLGYGMSANDFIKKFGTHFAGSTYYGGNYLQRRSVSKNEFSTSTSSEREFKADVEGTIKGVSVGVGTTQGSSQSSSDFRKITVSNKKVFTVGGDPSFDDPNKWAKTVLKNPEVIKGRLVPIYELLTKELFPAMSDIENKRKLLKVAVNKAIREAGNQLSKPKNHSFFSKTAVRFKMTIWSMKCTGQGSDEPGSASEYYGSLVMGFFAKDRRQVNGKRIWTRDEDNTDDFKTNQEKDINQTLEMTILPVDFAEGYAKVWGWMKEDDSPDTDLSTYSENSLTGKINYSGAMTLNNAVPGQLSFTSKHGDNVTVYYELKRIK